MTLQYVQREDGSVEARELHTVLNSLRHAELEPHLQGGGWALWSRGRGSEHGWSHQERSASFGPVPGLQNPVHAKSSARMVVGSCTLVAPSRARIPIQVYKSAANISRQMAKSVVEETVSVRTRLALQSPRPASSRRVELNRAP